jgi:hypothetical protein
MKQAISLALYLGIFFFSCGNSGTKVEKSDSSTFTPNFNLGVVLDSNIINAVKQYYYQNSKNIIQFDSTASISMNEEKLDSILDITFQVDLGEMGSPIVHSAKLPLFVGEDAYGGDLNNDTLVDLIYVVHTEGEGTSMGGGDAFHNDIFVFINNGKSLELVEVVNDRTLSKCKEWGHFYINKIENGQMLGESICHDEDDPMCCPSLNYNTTVKLINGHLKVVDSKFIKKTKQE